MKQRRETSAFEWLNWEIIDKAYEHMKINKDIRDRVIDWNPSIWAMAEKIYGTIVAEWALAEMQGIQDCQNDLAQSTKEMREFAQIALVAAEVFFNEALDYRRK